MSLINEMLKDLERRKNGEQNITAIPIADASGNKQSSTQNKLWLTLIAASLLLVSIGVFKVVTKNKIDPASIQFTANENPTPLTPTTNDSKWLAASNITGVTLQTKENITELTFMLNHPALYTISTNDVQNQLTIVIENTQLQSELPVTNSLNYGIQTISASQVKHDTEFKLTLNANASLKYVNMSPDDKNPELVVAIETSTGDHSTSAAIKTPVMQSLLIQRYQSALNDVKTGRYQQAISSLSDLLEQDPGYQDARAALAALLLDKGNKLQAAKVINGGLAIAPEYPPFIELKARLLTNEGKIQQALNLLQTAIPPINENPDYHALIAALYERSNKDLLAVRTYQKLLSLDTHNGSWWFGLAVSYDKLGKSKEAINAYERAISEGHLNSDSLAYLQKRLEKLQETDNDKT